MWRIQILISSFRGPDWLILRAPQPSICANWDIVKIFPSRTHQTWDNLNKQQRHFQEHARSVDRDVIWNLDIWTLENFILLLLRLFVASPLTLNYDHAHTVAVIAANCRTEPCCDDMHAQHTSCSQDAPMAPPSTNCSPSSTNHSFGGDVSGSALAGRNYCSKRMRGSFWLT